MFIPRIPNILIIIFAMMSGSVAYVALSQNELPLALAVAAAVVMMALFVFAGIFLKPGGIKKFGVGSGESGFSGSDRQY